MMSNVSAPPREYKAPPAREREPKKLDDTDETDEVSQDTDDDKDGTRSVQDLIAAALKMFAKAEPKVAPVPVEVPAINLAAAPTIEAAIQNVLDQIAAKPDEKITESDDKSSTDTRVETTAPD